jgi:hypothetical protein
MTLSLGPTLSRAWEIIWRHKILWIFGILAGCATGGGGGSGGSPNINVDDNNRNLQLPPEVERFLDQNAATLIRMQPRCRGSWPAWCAGCC